MWRGVLVSVMKGGDETVGFGWIVCTSDLFLVTGANGFVGSKVVEILLEYGFTNIRCLVRSENNIQALKSLGESQRAHVEIIQGNLLSREDCAQAVLGVSVIIHLAAGTGKSFAGCFMNSAVATRNLLDAARQLTHLKRFLSVSSLSVYSGALLRRGQLVDESSPMETEHMARFDPYCYGKIKQDELVMRYGKDYGIPFAIVRPGVVYGPGKRAIPGRVGIDTFGIFLHLGGANKLPIIFVDNCAEAVVLAAIVRGVNNEVFVAVDDELPRSRDFLRLFKKNVRRFPSIRIPYRLFYTLNWAWERYSIRSEGQLPPVFNRRICAAYYQRQRYTNQKLKDVTGWKPRVTFEEASRRYFEFMRQGGSK
jgi:nucleoside-diphosphate-sugar epimerase